MSGPRGELESRGTFTFHYGSQPCQDPIALLEEQAAERVPIGYGRMSASPFAVFRGAASVMASGLAGTPQTGIRVQLCGDAHLANFGGFASPERQLLFDLNTSMRHFPARGSGM